MSDEAWIHAVAGAAGGFLVMLPLYPLDQMRTFAQLQHPVPHWSEWKVWYRGHCSSQLAQGITNFIYFYSYHLLKTLKIANSDDVVLSPLQSLLLSTISGIVTVWVTAPFWVVNMRLKADKNQQYAGIIDCLALIIRDEGPAVLWNGTLPSMMLVSNPVIHYVTYEYLKSKFGDGASSLQYFCMGACSKMIATLTTYPLQVAQSKLRAADKNRDLEEIYYNGLVQCLLTTYRKYCYAGLYAGLRPKLLQTVLTAALTLAMYEKLVEVLRTSVTLEPALGAIAVNLYYYYVSIKKM